MIAHGVVHMSMVQYISCFPYIVVPHNARILYVVAELWWLFSWHGQVPWMIGVYCIPFYMRYIVKLAGEFSS